MSTSEQQSSSQPPDTDISSEEKKALKKGCLYSFLKVLGVILFLLLVGYFFGDNYERGSKAFEKGYWESAVDFLEEVDTDSEHYQEAQEKLKLAQEKLKPQQK